MKHEKLNVMKNISENGESLTLNENKSYIVIDALYLGQIKNYAKLDENWGFEEMENEIREHVFPYNNSPFAKFKLNFDEFKVEWIRPLENGEEYDLSKRFSSDTGMVLVFEISNFQYLIKTFDYNDFTNSTTGLVDLEYWRNIIEPLEQDSIGVIVAPGINSGYGFIGGGQYKIDL